jgi:hypothetical protein
MLSAVQHLLLQALYAESKPVSLPRLGKQLQLSGSVVLRALTPLGELDAAGQAGPGWVKLVMADARWTVSLTDAGRAWWSEQQHGG